MAARGWVLVVVGALLVAAASLPALPDGLGYDPWSWLVWGREMGHLSLDTRQAATAVKPLPMLVDTAVAVAGPAAPQLWLLLARAGALLALALAFRVATRLAGAVAGVAAAVGLAMADQYLGALSVMGMADPLVAAAVLAAVDCHLDGRRRAVVAFLVAAGLLRPEAWPALAGYCWWQSRGRPAPRQVLAVVGAGLVPATWFALDWLGSGQPARSAEAATHQSQGGPLLSRVPALATLGETWSLLSGPVLVLFVLGAALAVRRWRLGRHHAGPLLWLSAGAVGWVLIDAVLAQAGRATGAPRYLLGGAALACVVAGCLVAEVVDRLRPLPVAGPRHLAPALLAVALVAACAPRAAQVAGQVHRAVQVGTRLQVLRARLPGAVAAAGGRAAVLRCGVATSPFQVPLVAWQLEVPLHTVRVARGHSRGVVLHAGRRAWTVQGSCPGSVTARGRG